MVNAALLEGFVTRNLKHKNLITYIDLFIDRLHNSNTIDVYIVMPLYSMDLGKFLEKPPTNFDESQKVDFCIQLTSCIRYLHANNIIHRDLKPLNIFMEKVHDNWVLKIGDLGFASKLHHTEKVCLNILI